MVRPDRASLASTAPLDDLLTLLLRQFRRPLALHNVDLKDADAQAIAQAIVQRQPPDARAQAVRDALTRLIAESEAVLKQWNLTFEQAMETGMDAMPGWETTSEFLDLANEKSNAEIRIAAGSALVTALGDCRYLPHLLYLAARDDDDLDTAIARRVLLFQSGVDPAAPDWLARVRAWAEKQQASD